MANILPKLCDALVKSKSTCNIIMSNGFQMQVTVLACDDDCIAVKNDKEQYMVINAENISTIVAPEDAMTKALKSK